MRQPTTEMATPHADGVTVIPRSRQSRTHAEAPGASTELVVEVADHRVTVSILGAEYQTIPVLMCNGVGAEFRLWEDLRAQIRRTTVALDVQGPFMGRRPSMRTYAGFLASVLEQLEYDCVDVLGLSWGGIAAQQLAHDRPDLVRRLILASSTPGLMSVPPRPSSALALITPQRDADQIEKVITKLYAGDFLADPGLAPRLGLTRSVDERTYRRQMWALLGWSSVPWLRTVRHQTLILHADDDRVVPYVNARFMKRLMPNATLEAVHEGGHLFLYTRPEVYGPRITDFLAQPSSRGRPARRRFAGRMLLRRAVGAGFRTIMGRRLRKL